MYSINGLSLGKVNSDISSSSKLLIKIISLNVYHKQRIITSKPCIYTYWKLKIANAYLFCIVSTSATQISTKESKAGFRKLLTYVWHIKH